jgi:intracellular multiplication protein IcmL
MTLSQKRLTGQIKPLTLGLATLLIASTFISPLSQAATNGTTNVITSSPSTTTTPSSDNSTGMAAPTTTSTSTTSTTATTAPGTVTTTTTTPAPAAPTIINKNEGASPNAPANQANMSDNDVLNWASTAAQQAYTYDFKNYQKQLQMLQDQFTPEGWKAFMAALKQSNNLNVVQTRKLVASATPTGKATIVKEGVINNLYTWKIQLPMQAVYESESRLIKQNLIVTMLVTRSTSNPKGVGITHFVAVVVPANQPPISNTPAQTAPTSMSADSSNTNIYNQGTGVSGVPSSTVPTPGVNAPPSTTPTTPSNTMTTPSTPNPLMGPSSTGNSNPNNLSTPPSTTTTPPSNPALPASPSY